MNPNVTLTVPPQVLAAVREACDADPGDLAACVAQALAAVRALPDYAALTDALVRRAVYELACDHRHQQNRRLKAASGNSVPPAKQAGGRVSVGGSRAVNAALGDWYAYHIAGRVLGDLDGAELPALAAGERARARGHAFNAIVCEKLAPLVKPGRKVRDAVRPARLRELVEQARAEAGEAGDGGEDAPSAA